MTNNMHAHGLNRSIITHLRARFPNARVDLKFDGYKMSADRPLILVESLVNNFSGISKQREGINAAYHYQIGLFDENSVNLSINQERLQNVFMFDRFNYYDTLQSPQELAGYFYCELSAVTPMPTSDITKQSEYNRVYFDVEITTTKRSCY